MPMSPSLVVLRTSNVKAPQRLAPDQPEKERGSCDEGGDTEAESAEEPRGPNVS
jgi:hypothetical protein